VEVLAQGAILPGANLHLNPAPGGPADMCRIGSLPLLSFLLAVPVTVVSCVTLVSPDPSTIRFDRAEVWVHARGDSIPLQVELARTHDQQALGLSGRSGLPPEAGMLFLFEGVRADTTGFWMWQTAMPLDLAFLDEGGRILRIVGMDPCMRRVPEDCPLHLADVEYRQALEVNRGWFDRHGVGVGDRVAPPRP